MNFLRSLLYPVLIGVMAVPALAWGPIGHMAVAYIAYDGLTPAAKARVRDLLKLHPDYASWEKQIPAGTSADDHDRIIFVIASTWADDIKLDSRYSDDGSDGGNTADGASSSQNTGYSDRLRHRYWHFVNTPFSPDSTPSLPIPTPNAQTQIFAFRAVLASSQADELKSYDLVWLVHLIADVHQPLHAATRFTKAFPHGDTGGNSVKLFGDADSTLHAYWDNLSGSDCKFCTDKMLCVNRAVVLGKSIRPVNSNHVSTDASVWIHESFDQARTKVYRDPIGTGDQLYSIVPVSRYETQAYKLIKMRLAVAGARLAKVLNEELK